MKLLAALLSLTLLVGCSKKDSNVTQPENPYIQKNYAASDPAVKLDMVQFTSILKNIYPALNITYPKNVSFVRLLPSDVNPDANFIQYNNWFSVKLIKNDKNDLWSGMLTEVYSEESYEASKALAFNNCKKIWGHIDNRVPTVIDELQDRINSNETYGKKDMVQHVRYGYLFILDVSHYDSGYPVSCTIAIDKIKNGTPSV